MLDSYKSALFQIKQHDMRINSARGFKHHLEQPTIPEIQFLVLQDINRKLLKMSCFQYRTVGQFRRVEKITLQWYV